MKKVVLLTALYFLLSLFLLTARVGVLPGASPAFAQTATDSADDTDSADATDESELEYPEELPETGSADIAFSLGIGGFLILTAIVTRVTLAKLTDN
jgi:hypothetical protein